MREKSYVQQSVLITGAGKGLGFALASQLFLQQYNLYLVVRKQSAKELLIKSFPQAKVLVCDITAQTYSEQLATWLGDAHLDVIINNAGAGSKGNDLASATALQLQQAFNTHCVGAFSTVQSSLENLKRSSQPLIINISSRRGSMSMQAEGAAKGSGCSYSYRIGKAAQNMLSLCLADELEELGIRVAAVHPGRLLTQLAASDAVLDVEESASRLVKMIIENSIKTRDYLCMETGKLAW